MDDKQVDILDCITRLERGEQTPEDVELIARFVRAAVDFHVGQMAEAEMRDNRFVENLIAKLKNPGKRVEIAGYMRWDIPIDAMFCKCDNPIQGAGSQTCKNCGGLIVQ